MPVMRWRVVCALREVMLIFWPTSAFISVDLPTFGRPTIATVPQRKPGRVGTFMVLNCRDGKTRRRPPHYAAENACRSWVVRVGRVRPRGVRNVGDEFRL